MKSKMRLECVNKKKNVSKFWEYKILGSMVNVKYGRIGTFGNGLLIPLYQLNSKLKEKARKGYKEVKQKN